MIHLILLLALLGFLLWLLMKYVPMEPIFRNLIYFVVVVAVIFWVMNLFEINDYWFPRHESVRTLRSR